jgi:chromosome segregation ATPase
MNISVNYEVIMKVIKITKQAMTPDMEQKAEQEFRNLDHAMEEVQRKVQQWVQQITEASPREVSEVLSGIVTEIEGIQDRYQRLGQEIKQNEMNDDNSRIQKDPLQSNAPENIGEGNQGNQVGSPYSTPLSPTGPQVGPPATGQ